MLTSETNPVPSPAHDPVTARLLSTLADATTDWGLRDTQRDKIGLLSVKDHPYIEATVQTEKRTYEGRVFHLDPNDGLLHLYDDKTYQPIPTTSPTVSVRASAVVSVSTKHSPWYGFTSTPFLSRKKTEALLDAAVEPVAAEIMLMGLTDAESPWARDFLPTDKALAKLVNHLKTSGVILKWRHFKNILFTRHDYSDDFPTLGQDPRWGLALEAREGIVTLGSITCERAAGGFPQLFNNSMPYEFLFEDTREAIMDACDEAVAQAAAKKRSR